MLALRVLARDPLQIIGFCPVTPGLGGHDVYLALDLVDGPETCLPQP